MYLFNPKSRYTNLRGLAAISINCSLNESLKLQQIVAKSSLNDELTDMDVSPLKFAYLLLGLKKHIL